MKLLTFEEILYILLSVFISGFCIMKSWYRKSSSESYWFSKGVVPENSSERVTLLISMNCYYNWQWQCLKKVKYIFDCKYIKKVLGISTICKSAFVVFFEAKTVPVRQRRLKIRLSKQKPLKGADFNIFRGLKGAGFSIFTGCP